VADTSAAQSVVDALNDAPLSRYHLRAVVTAGMGFFTDAYDLFVIGVALALIKVEYHPSPLVIGLVGSTALIAAFVGALVFGRLADVLGRKRVYGLEAAIMAVAAIATAFSPNLVWLIAWRFVLGVGIGGDYPVSAVLMSEYANRRDRGRLVSLVFSMQALGLIAGPLVALVILAVGTPHDIAWRILLGLGALPALGVIYLRRRMPESPRYTARALGREREAAEDLHRYAGRAVSGSPHRGPAARLSLAAFLTTPRYLVMLLGTAGAWFFFDYAYYGNTISSPIILRTVLPSASLIQATAITLGIFTVCAAPGYVLAFLNVDRIGHRRLQLIGFAVMGLAFLLIGIVPRVTTLIVPFLALYGVSYLFTEFGPNTTTFVLAAELYPVSARTTGHGVSAGMAKLGAFVGTLTFPLVNTGLGLPAVMLIASATAGLGLCVTLVLPEPSGRTLEESGGELDGEPFAARLAPEASQPVASC